MLMKRLLKVALFAALALSVPTIAYAASSAPSADCCCPLCCH
jgi:hypothetical protein